MSNFDFEKYLPCGYWAETVIDDVKEIGAIIGFNIENVYFSGFWSQGDGACFTGSLSYAKGASRLIRQYTPNDTELHDIADRWTALQKANFYAITGTVKHRGHYYHSGCTSFDFEDSRYCYGWTNGGFDEEEAKQIVRDFMGWIYTRLEKEYYYSQAYNLATAWIDIADEMKESRKEARGLVSAMRQERKAGKAASAAICKALRAQLAMLRESWKRCRQERKAIEENFHYTDDNRKYWTIQEFAEANI